MPTISGARNEARRTLRHEQPRHPTSAPRTEARGPERTRRTRDEFESRRASRRRNEGDSFSPTSSVAPSSAASNASTSSDGVKADAGKKPGVVPHKVQPRGSKLCYDYASKMAKAGGGDAAKGRQDRLQIATGEGRDGRVTVDPEKAKQGKDYIDRRLEAGKPVVVGVSYKNGKLNNGDHVTDHFVTITGRGSDTDPATGQKRQYYTFNDPGSRNGADTNPRNRFYVDPKTHMLYRENANGADASNKGASWVNKRFEVSQVR